MKVAAAQTFVSADIAENGRTIRESIRQAAERQVRLVLFCEGALSGYSKAQVAAPSDWLRYDWAQLDRELAEIAATCKTCGIHAVVGSAHPVSERKHPTNSLIVISDQGLITGRYDKRFLSNSEVNDWYMPGTDPLVVTIDGFRFGCAICIEAAFPEPFAEYERLGADAVLFASYGITQQFKTALQAHAYSNCYWIVASPPAQKAHKYPAFICGPEGDPITQAVQKNSDAFAVADLDREDPAYEVALARARPWRAKAREGGIYRDKRNRSSDY